ncbi:MAG: biotin transporter BioY [Gemmatimonadetes bacterium]|nr:biotin transporter BioY [Gemmatimonadota bacterium]
MIETEVGTELVIQENTVSPAVSRPTRSVAARRAWSLSLDHSVGLSLGIVLFAALTAAGAYASVPMAPVPMTLQTLFVLLAGTILGPSAGAMSQMLYLAVGAAGAPVFASGAAGLPWLFGPTGGFLMAFPVAAAVAGWLAGSRRRVWPTLLGLALGSVLIFIMGAAWLGATTEWSGSRIVQVAVLPFLFGAVVKMGIALLVTRQVARAGRR